VLHSLVPDIRKTAELIREISSACSEQSTGAEQVNKAIQQLDHVIQQNAASSEEMAATAEELSSQAESLESSISFFKVGTKLPERSASAFRSRKSFGTVTQAQIATTSLAKMRNAVSGPGPAISLDTNCGGADARDESFTTYEE
jgi:methyl-accepting chemotaxis protein